MFIGVDVGTGSARACLVSHDGQLVASCTEDIRTWRDPDDHRIFEQSTENIWQAIATCIKNCVQKTDQPVLGIGFAATCSLAVIDGSSNDSIAVTPGGDAARNIILWADHRAESEANLINSTGASILRYLGGTMSLEMELPKILWLKNNLSSADFSRAQFFDLPDWLSFRATGSRSRSSCSLTAKFLPDLSVPEDIFRQIGLAEVVDRGYDQVGFPTETIKVLNAGMPVGRLTSQSAAELGLSEDCVVASSLIDAYGGWVGTVAGRYTDMGQLSAIPSINEAERRLAAVAGTSTCHLVQSRASVFVPGVWGPYHNAVFPGYWMNEGGQSSTGQLIDFVLTTHPAYSQLKEKAGEKNIHVVLQELLEGLKTREGTDTLTELTKDLHFYPDLHGNRSPIADSTMRGSITGLTLDSSLSDLAKKYHLTLESIALQNRHIVEEMNKAGHSIDRIYMSGGQARNIALMQLFADTTGLEVVLPANCDAAVVLGAAILGRYAKEGGELWDIMVQMTPAGTVLKPSASPKEKKLLDAKYKIFRESIEIQRRWRREIQEALA